MTIPFHTMTGTIDLAALGPEHVTAAALGDTLAKVNRFNGRTARPWPVSSHSLLVERLVTPVDLKGWALLHDAHEAFIGDMTSPAQELICRSGTRAAVVHAIQNAKGRLDRLIGAAWECPPRSHTLEIRRADWIALQAEMLWWFGATPEAQSPADIEDIRDACDMIPELPHGARWTASRDAWITRAEELDSMGLLRLPRPRQSASTVLAG